MKTCIALLFSLIFGASAFGMSMEFSVPTKDGVTTIQGQIDYPECENKKFPVVMIVGGTGLFYRNGFFGNSKTERDYLFKDLSQGFAKKCIATLRFDDRGVKCDLDSRSKISICVNQNLRKTVTDQTILDDIWVVFTYLRSQTLIDPSKIVLFGHSEGSINIARLIEKNRVDPRALMFIGGVTESAKSILHWQLTDKNRDSLLKMDRDNDGYLTNQEMMVGWNESDFKEVVPVESFLSPSGFWTKESLDAEFSRIYKQQVIDTLAMSQDVNYLSSGVVYSNIQWWKRWFTDEKTVLESLSDFEGPIVYHNGDKDSQTPAAREKEFLEKSQVAMKSKPIFMLHSGKGHGLSSHSLYGPIDPAIYEQIIEQVSTWVN